MKIEINILPDSEKEKIKEEKKIGFVLELFFSFIAVLLLVNVVLYFMQIGLDIEYKAAKKSSEASFSKNYGKENQLEKYFQETDSQVKKISQISSSISNWSKVLRRLSELSPEGIRISKITVRESQLNVSGFSKTRDDFLNFQDRLKAESFLFSVDLSNLVASSNFDFDLELKITENYLIRE